MTVTDRPTLDGHRPAGRDLGPPRPPRPVRPAAGRGARGLAPRADDTGFWAVTKHADVVAVSRDSATYSSELGGAFIPTQDEEALSSLRLTILMMDPPKHHRYRRLVSRGLHAPDDRQPGRGDRSPRRPGRRRGLREGRGRVRRGDRGPGPGPDDLRDDRPGEVELAPDVRAEQPAHRLPGRPRLPGRGPDDGLDGGLRPLRRGGRRPSPEPPRRPHDRPGRGRGRRRAPDRPRAQPLLHHPDRGRQRDHPEPDQPLAAGHHRPPRPGPAPAGRPVPVGHGDRRDAPLGQLDPQLPAHGHEGHRAAGRAHRRGRQGRRLLRLGQPGRGRLRRQPHLRRRAHAQRARDLRRRRRALLPRRQPGPGRDQGDHAPGRRAPARHRARPGPTPACTPTS